MQEGAAGLLARTKRQFVADYAADPWLKYVLALALLLTGFFFWHRIPGFATVDERWRLLDVMLAVGTFAADPGLESLRSAVLAERLAGATLYLYGIALLPVFIAVAATGQLGAFAAVTPHQYPVWVWTWSLLLARFVNVLLAVGCVYLTYRIGVQMRDRTTGRLAALLLTLTFGFLVMAHEVGEDIPALFVLLLVVSVALQYTETGEDTTFLVGCVLCGFAIAFKLTAATGVVVLGIAYLLRARTVQNWRAALFRPRLVGLGVALFVAALVVGYPEVLVDGPLVLAKRIFNQLSYKAMGLGGPDAPSWWWMLRGYLSGLGVPFFLAALCGVAASVFRIRDRSVEGNATVLLLVGISTYLIVYTQWEYVRLHHLLPTFPMLALLIAAALSRLHARNRSLARPLVAVLLVTGGTYAVVGDFQYAISPRDEAAEWLNAHAPENATMEVYRMRFRDAVFPRDMQISSYQRKIGEYGSGHRKRTKAEWMLDMPKRCPTYIQLTYWDLTYLDMNGPNRTRPVPWVATRGGPEPVWMPDYTAPRRTEYIHDLLAGEYAYTIVAEFGPRPPLWPRPRYQTAPIDLLRAGIVPWTVTYGDDQDFRAEQYTLILKRTDSCTPNATHHRRRNNAAEIGEMDLLTTIE